MSEDKKHKVMIGEEWQQPYKAIRIIRDTLKKERIKNEQYRFGILIV